jgi:hypothetical protein
MSGDAVWYMLEEQARQLRETIKSDPELLNRFNAEYEKADMDNARRIIVNFKQEYENKKEGPNYKSLLDRFARGGKKRRQKKTKKSRKSRKTRKLRKTRARK